MNWLYSFSDIFGGENPAVAENKDALQSHGTQQAYPAQGA